MGKAEADRENARYEQFLPNRTDTRGRPIDEHGDLVAAAGGGTMDPTTVAVDEPAAEETPKLPWYGVLAPLGVKSSDFRRIDPPPNNTLLTRDMPLPLLFQEKLSPGHMDGEQGLANITAADIVTGAQAVELGLAEEGRVDPEALFLVGEGSFDDQDPEAVALANKVDNGFARWTSVDLDNVGEIIWHKYRGEEDLGPVDWEEEDGWLILDFFANHTEFAKRHAMVTALAVEKYGLDDAAEELVEVISQWRLMGATLVSHPAFHEAFIKIKKPPADEPDPELMADYALIAAVIGDTNLPIADDRDRAWDSGAAKQRVQEWATAEGADGFDPAKVSKAFLWRDNNADETTIGAYKYPFADVIDGTLTIVARAVFSAAGYLESGDIPAADKDKMRGKLSTLYGRLAKKYNDDTITPPWQTTIDPDRALTPAKQYAAARTSMVASAGEPDRQSWAHMVASVAKETLFEPPAEFFADPKLTRPTALVIEPNGHVYGHVHDWTTAHRSYGRRRNIRAPRSHSGYAGFNLRPVRCADGGKVKCGALVAGTTHASTARGVGAHQAGSHYDHTGKRLARIRVGPDDFGTWFAGALVPSVTPEQILDAAELSVSGDWRDGELVAALVVNVPGLPIIEGDEDAPEALVAAGMIIRTEPMPMPLSVSMPATVLTAAGPGPAAIAAEVVRLMRGEQTRGAAADQLAGHVYAHDVAALAARVHGGA